MKFDYRDIGADIVNGQRWYMTPAGKMPSITTILGHTQPPEKAESLQRWRDSMGHAEADAFTARAATNGTNVHLLIERYLKGEDVMAPINGDPVPEQSIKGFNSLKLKLKSIDEVWGQEVALYSEFFKVAGRCDFVGVFKKVPAIVDFKTSSRIKSEADIEDYKLQLAFYAAAHNEMFGTNIQDGFILMAAGSGFPIEFRFNLEEFYDKLYERSEMFWSKL